MPETLGKGDQEGSFMAVKRKQNPNLRLGTDPRKGDQTVRGTCELPHNNGKKNVILFVCTSDDTKKIALENGADMVIDKDVIEDVEPVSQYR